MTADDAYDDVVQLLVRIVFGDELLNLLLSVALSLSIDYILDAIVIIPIFGTAPSVISGRKDGCTLGLIAAFMVVAESPDFLLFGSQRRAAENHLLECAG